MSDPPTFLSVILFPSFRVDLGKMDRETFFFCDFEDSLPSCNNRNPVGTFGKSRSISLPIFLGDDVLVTVL